VNPDILSLSQQRPAEKKITDDRNRPVVPRNGDLVRHGTFTAEASARAVAFGLARLRCHRQWSPSMGLGVAAEQFVGGNDSKMGMGLKPVSSGSTENCRNQ
jgi:hypothetical protein